MVLQSLCPLWHWQRQQRDGSGAELLDCAAWKNEKVCRTDHNILQWSIKQRSNRYITLLVWLIYWVFIVFLSVLCSSTFNVHGKLTAQATMKQDCICCCGKARCTVRRGGGGVYFSPCMKKIGRYGIYLEKGENWQDKKQTGYSGSSRS